MLSPGREESHGRGSLSARQSLALPSKKWRFSSAVLRRDTMPLLLGCIADDFTGATDLANTLVKGGMTAVQVIGVPEGLLPEADAVIIALKSRTAPVREAVGESLAAAEALLAAGARQLFFKYCSTFDST